MTERKISFLPEKKEDVDWQKSQDKCVRKKPSLFHKAWNVALAKRRAPVWKQGNSLPFRFLETGTSGD